MALPPSINLFESNSDFWTTDDEDENDDEVSLSPEFQGESPKLTTQEHVAFMENDGPPGLEIHPSKVQYPLIEIPGGSVSQAETLNQENSFQEIPKKKSYVRKKWVIEDSSDISNFHDQVPVMAMKFPFELDAFQKRAIIHLERNEHIFVAAHTSAGKTVIAEYAIALALRCNRRVVYTSPIKALSNQKYLEFSQKFPSVGIVTGDVSINKDASCVIMTTEILRSAIYSSDPLLNSLETVIFDEVHYINDAERGVVWEEVILLLPDNVNMVMLSATAPNYRDFADWIGRARQRDVFAVLTLQRPVPLKHYLYFDDKAFMLMNSDEKFKNQAYSEMYQYSRRKFNMAKEAAPKGTGKAAPKPKSARPQIQSVQAKYKTDTRRLRDLIKSLEKEDKLPVVIFCFSRKTCEDYALFLGKTKFISTSDESKVHLFLKKSLSGLNADDRTLPQISAMEELLLCGVGVHHGGLLPIMKEVVEMLFSRGLIRILFATETFAMGLNMPARSVIFSSIQKHDGSKLRFLQPSEYTQMAGRAGRRGLDDFGFVYIFSSTEPPEQRDLVMMMIHRSSPLISQFRVTFLMILQLMNSSSLRVEDMMSKSFRESTRLQKHDVAQRDYKRFQKKLAEIEDIECSCGNNQSIQKYVDLELNSRELAYEVHKFFWKENHRSHVFCPGRVIILHSLPSIKSSCIGLILSKTSETGLKSNTQPKFECLILLSGYDPEEPEGDPQLQSHFLSKSKKAENIDLLAYGTFFSHAKFYNSSELPNQTRRYKIFGSIPMEKISMISTSTIKIDDHFDVDNEIEVKVVVDKLEKLELDFENPLVPLASHRNFKSIILHFYDIINQQTEVYSKLNESPTHYCSRREDHFRRLITKKQYIEYIEEIDRLLKVESLECYSSMKEKIHVLKMLDYLDNENRLTLKGQVGCLVMTGDDIILPEIIFENCLSDLTPEEIAGTLGTFAGSTPDKQDSFPTRKLLDTIGKISDINSKLLAILQFDALEINKTAFSQIFCPSFAFISYLWATGTPFSRIMEKTSLQEGSIVRTLLRLDEIIKRIKLASTLIGDSDLEKKLQTSSEKIHRDIIFNMSLYLQ